MPRNGWIHSNAIRLNADFNSALDHYLPALRNSRTRELEGCIMEYKSHEKSRKLGDIISNGGSDSKVAERG